MKKFLVLLVIFGVGFINLGAVNADPTQENQISIDYQPATEMEPTFIDDVPVPFNVLVYTQVVYQGYAVTQAEEINLSGKKIYRLRVDNDSNPELSKGFYLLYDETWKLIDKQPLATPVVAVSKPEVSTEAQVKPQVMQQEVPAEELVEVSNEPEEIVVPEDETEPTPIEPETPPEEEVEPTQTP